MRNNIYYTLSVNVSVCHGVTLMSEREEELKQAILHFVEETQEDINIVLTQTMAMNAVMKDIGGSTNNLQEKFLMNCLMLKKTVAWSKPM